MWKEGEFLNGELNGWGEVYREDGSLRYEGQFINGELIGEKNDTSGAPLISSNHIKNQKDKDVQKENSIKLKEIQKKLQKEEKERKRKFRISYAIRLKKEISSQDYTGSVLGTLLGYDKIKQVKTVQNEKGEKIERFIDIWHKGAKLPSNIAKHYVQEQDKDVKSGRAGTSTIVVMEIKMINSI